MRPVVTIEGRINEPALKFSKDGKAFLTFSLASTERIRDDEGGWQDGETSWYRCIAFGNTAEVAADLINKGDRVLVHGPVKITKWEGDKGVMYNTEVTCNAIGLISKPKNRSTEAPW